MRRFAIIATLIALLGPAPLTSVAVAETDDPKSVAILNDPAGDAAWPRGDAVRAWLVHRPTTLQVMLKVAEYTDPTLDPRWVQGDSAIAWKLDTVGDHQPDWIVRFRHGARGLVGHVVRASDNALVCVGEAFASEAGQRYGFRFERSCVGSPARARFFAGILWDQAPFEDNEPTVDVVHGPYGPDERWSRWTFAPCANPYSSTIRMSTPDDTIDHGDTVVFRVRIVRQHTNIGIPYERVELHRYYNGAWSTVDVARADAEGRARLTDVPPDDAAYRAHHPASSCANALTTPNIDITVQ